MSRQKELHLCSNNENFSLIADVTIEPSSCTTFLGLQLDKNLNFKEHVNSTAKKLTKALYVLSRASKVLPKDVLKTLYSSLFLPHLNYGMLVWGGPCMGESFFQELDKGPMSNPLNSLKNLHSLQKRAIRIISGKKRNDHHIPLCYELQILDLKHIYSVRSLSFFYEYIHGTLPPFFTDKLTLYSSRHSTMLIKTNYRRTKLASLFLLNTLPEIWNPLPEEVKTMIFKSKATFIKKIKLYYLSSYNNWKCDRQTCYSCAK